MEIPFFVIQVLKRWAQDEETALAVAQYDIPKLDQPEQQRAISEHSSRCRTLGQIQGFLKIQEKNNGTA